MDLHDSPEEAEFRAEARTFLEAHAPGRLPGWSDVDIDEAELVAANRAWQRTLFEHGWASITWPREYGGRGLGPTQQIIWNQELGRVGMGENPFLQGVGLAGPTIIAHGTPEQKKRYLAPILRADELWCQLFSEPGAGSDLAALAAPAEKDGDSWVITGQKTWCSSGHLADRGMLLARSDPTVRKHRGITYFLLDMHSPGIEVRPLRQLSGDAHFTEVFLDEVHVPDADRLGPEGGGWRLAMTTLMNERMTIGGLERLFSFESLIEHARAHPERVDGALRNDLGRLYTWSKALELLNARVITKLGRGQIPDAESSVMKVAIGRLLSEAGVLGMRLLGPEAMLRHGEWQNRFLVAPAVHIGGGTDEIQKNICAERILGLPRETRADRDLPFDQLPRS